jgi:hypothetical protein
MSKCGQVLLVVVTALAPLAVVAAQGGLPAGIQLNPGTISVSGNGNFIVIGCLSRVAADSPRFTVTDSRATPPAIFAINGDPDLLRIHVGHTIEIAGPVSATAGQSEGMAIKMLSLTYISPKCQKLKE